MIVLVARRDKRCRATLFQVSDIYLRGHWHEDLLLRYDRDAHVSEVLKARQLPRDQRYTVGRFQEDEAGHLFALFATADGPVLMINDAIEVPLAEAELSIEDGDYHAHIHVAVRGVEIVNVRYTARYGDEWFDREDFELPSWLVKHYREKSLIEAHTRTTPSPTWWLWLKDRFEYPPPPRAAVAAGPSLEAGYRELWKRHLLEGMDDEGRSHFSEFTLDVVDESGDRGLSLREREERDQMIQLRAWAKESESVPYTLARAHVALLDGVEDPVAKILATVDDAYSAENLGELLTRLAE
jgi:hypothetical protein